MFKKNPRVKRNDIALLSVACAGLLVSGCVQELEPVGSPLGDLSFEEWRDSLPQADTGAYIVERDIPLRTEEALLEYFHQRYGNSSALTVDLYGGQDNIWPLSQRHDLTYCIDDSFSDVDPAWESEVINAMYAAEADWELAADVRFRHDTNEDGAGCDNTNNNVVFNVRLGVVNGGRAMAFLPQEPRADRELIIEDTAILDELDGDRPLHGLLAHELGHVLGFKHELYDWDTCSSWPSGVRQLTELDTASVMHYPGTCSASHPSGDYELSELDRLGAMCLYTHNMSRAACDEDRTGFDYIWRSSIGKNFATEPQTVNGLYEAISGDFDGDGKDDIIWYGRGSRGDWIWWGQSTGFTKTSTTVNGIYDPFVGDFNGDGRDDVFWYGPGAQPDVMWRGQANRTFVSVVASVNGIYQPLTADFDGNGCDDVLWYRPESGADATWYFDNDGSHTSHAVTVNENYRPVTGDFDGDGRGDIFWYLPGTGNDGVWWGTATRGSFSVTSQTVNGWYQPFAGDFDGDGRSEIFWYHAGTGSDSIWEGSANRTFSSRSTSVDKFYSPFTGDFDGDGDDDIFWYGPLD